MTQHPLFTEMLESVTAPVADFPELAAMAQRVAAEHNNNKAITAYRTISEAADILGVPQHVLRFWESKFSQIQPMKRSGGRRYYSLKDMALLQQIKALLYDQGYTIKGVQKLLKARRALAASAVFGAGFAENVPSHPDLPNFSAAAPQPVVEIPTAAPAAAAVSEEPRGFDLSAIAARVARYEPVGNVPDHLPEKPAALMRAGLEAGRPLPEIAAEIVETPEWQAGSDIEQAIEASLQPEGAVPASPQLNLQLPLEGKMLNTHQRARLEDILAELKLLKGLLG